jgi:hypothetical protein
MTQRPGWQAEFEEHWRYASGTRRDPRSPVLSRLVLSATGDGRGAGRNWLPHVALNVNHAGSTARASRYAWFAQCAAAADWTPASTGAFGSFRERMQSIQFCR